MPRKIIDCNSAHFQRFGKMPHSVIIIRKNT